MLALEASSGSFLARAISWIFPNGPNQCYSSCCILVKKRGSQYYLQFPNININTSLHQTFYPKMHQMHHTQKRTQNHEGQNNFLCMKNTRPLSWYSRTQNPTEIKKMKFGNPSRHTHIWVCGNCPSGKVLYVCMEENSVREVASYLIYNGK